MRVRERQFFLQPESFDSGFWSSFGVLWNVTKPITPITYSAYLFRSVGSRKSIIPGKSLTGSLVVHAAAIFLVVHLGPTFTSVVQTTQANLATSERIYYLPAPYKSQKLPRIVPPGQGGKPGRGLESKSDRKPGKSVTYPDLTVISNSIHPDNAFQTIIQSSSPPDLIIKRDLKLPNVVLGPMASPTRPQISVTPMRPIDAPRKYADVAVPRVAVTNMFAGLTLDDQAVKPARPELPLTPIRPIDLPRKYAEITAPRVASADPSMMVSLIPTVQRPGPPVPVTPLEVPRLGSSTSNGSTGGGRVAAGGNPRDANGLLIMGVDPVGEDASISLPPGNRYGAFSISPTGGAPGPPGGVGTGAVGAGTGGPGAGGDTSFGIGNGQEGGGGGGLANGAEIISITGRGTAAEGHGVLGVSASAAAVFPVITLPRVHKNSFVISSGTTGGGGLGVYHVLECNRIYTIFVPMPAADWILQYCEKAASQSAPTTAATTQVVQMQEPLFPPDPVEKFDFRRLPVPADKASQMLVIKGIVRADGSVDNLEVFQGVLKQMDDRAVEALRRWKFIPARRGEKSVAVWILVGIQLSSAVAR
jgi:hypothetical protein